MKKNIYALWVFLLMITVSAFAARVLDVDQIRSSDRVKLWTLPTSGLIASSGTLEVSNGTSTLTNKSISLGANTLTSTSAQLSTALSDETGSGAAVFGTGPTLSAPLISTISNTGTLTLPTSTDTLVGRATTDTLTNKTVSGGTISGADIDGSTASNTSRLTLPKAAKTTLDALTRKQGNIMYDTTSGKPYYDTGSVLKPVGSGSGGEKNYLTDYNNNTGNGDIELGATTGWALGHGDVDSTTKMLTTATFGSGASGNLSIGTVGGSSALAGSYSLSYTSSAATTAGDFLASDAFTIDPEDKAKPLRFQFNYMVASGGTFATWSGLSSTNSFQVALYDVTNSQLIQPSGNATMTTSSGSLSGMGYGEFQTSASGTQYRLIVYNANATTGAIQINFDSFKVGLNPKVYGSPITDFIAYTPTGSWVANSTYTGFWRRSGDMMEIQARVVTSGAPTSADLTFSLPSGYSIDTSKHTGTTQVYGSADIYDSGVRTYVGNVVYASSSTVFVAHSESGNAGFVNQANPITFGASDLVVVTFRVPITGWSSSVQMSDTSDTRVVASRAHTASTVITTTNNATIVFGTSTFDTHGAYNTSTGTYTAPVSGYYRATAMISTGAVAHSVNGYAYLRLYKNGSTYANLHIDHWETTASVYSTQSGSVIAYANAGDTLNINVNNQSGGTLTLNGTSENWVSFEHISDSSQIAASETVSARYTTAAGQTLEAAGSGEVIDFGTKVYDSHGSVTTGASWRFTAPISGIFRVKSQVQSASVAWTAGNSFTVYIRKNGSNYTAGEWYTEATTTKYLIVPHTATVRLLAGEYIDIFVDHDRTGGDFALRALGLTNFVEIDRVGNY